MTGSEDHILGRFPRHPLPLGEQVGVSGEALVGGVTSPCSNLDYIVPSGDEQADEGVAAGVRRVPVSESQRFDGGTPDSGSPVRPDDRPAANACDHRGFIRPSSAGASYFCTNCRQVLGYRREYWDAAYSPGLGGLNMPTPDADAPVDEQRVVPDLTPGEANHLAGAQSRVRQEAYNKAVTRLYELVSDRFDITYRDWATLDRTLRDWLETDAGVALAHAILHGRTDGSTHDVDGAVDGVPALAHPVEGGAEPLDVRARKLRKARAAKLREDVEVEQTGSVHLGAALPGDPVVVEPVLDPLCDGEIAVGQRLSVTLELGHEGDGLWLAGESLRVHGPTGTPSDAPRLAGSFLMVEPHGPGRYSATVRGVVKSVVMLADD